MKHVDVFIGWRFQSSSLVVAGTLVLVPSWIVGSLDPEDDFPVRIVEMFTVKL
jgi:hypothetical protein